MRFRTGHALTVVMAALFLAALLSSFDWEWGSRLFVQAIAVPGLLLCLLGFARENSRISSSGEGLLSYGDTPIDRSVPKPLLRRRSLNIFAWIGGLFLLIWLVNFRLAVPLFTFLYLRYQARESVFLSLVLGAFMLALIIGFFDMILHVPWPEGIIQTWIGL